MRDTRPQKASASEHSYRNTGGTHTQTAPVLKELAEAALALLAVSGARATDGSAWSCATTTPAGTRFDIRCTGPDLPRTVPAQTVHPSMIPKLRPWVGKYRLIVSAPLLVFDMYWNADEPLRIMNFSRGDWERDLRLCVVEVAGTAGKLAPVLRSS